MFNGTLISIFDILDLIEDYDQDVDLNVCKSSCLCCDREPMIADGFWSRLTLSQ